MAIALTEDVRKLIDGPNFAHLATIMPDGSPQSAPVWVTREGDLILVGTGEGSLKAKNTRRIRGSPSRSWTSAIPTSRRRSAAGWSSGDRTPHSC